MMGTAVYRETSLRLNCVRPSPTDYQKCRLITIERLFNHLNDKYTLVYRIRTVKIRFVRTFCRFHVSSFQNDRR